LKHAHKWEIGKVGYSLRSKEVDIEWLCLPCRGSRTQTISIRKPSKYAITDMDRAMKERPKQRPNTPKKYNADNPMHREWTEGIWGFGLEK
jgi:hypothetical protein